VLSYAGSGLGRVAVNMVTVPVSEPPFADVAQLIASFNNNVYFRDVYVPSISRGLTEDGTTTLSFVLNMDFEEPETGSEDLNVGLTGTAVVDDAPRVPRNPNN
ncbi:hypothetical protein IT411_02210, partial [Candidatus Peregrinibacteria bacterium]|nr:hypothetical protein [Candidatus Peregrinibacteria bacterium]